MTRSTTTVLGFRYKVSSEGEILDQTGPGEVFWAMSGDAGLMPAVEAALLAMKTGEKRSLSLRPAEAFGEHDSTRVMRVPRSELPGDQFKVGDEFRMRMPKAGDSDDSDAEEHEHGEDCDHDHDHDGHDHDDEDDAWTFRLVGFTLEEAILDANHPYAGKSIDFELELVDRRAPTEEELAHGHAHGPGGHHVH